MPKRLPESELRTLRPLARRAEEHWRRFLPNLYAGLLESGKLRESLAEAAEAHVNALYELEVLQRVPTWQAEEIVNPMFLFPSPEDWEENPGPPKSLTELLRRKP
jgi:hypothetical protein